MKNPLFSKLLAGACLFGTALVVSMPSVLADVPVRVVHASENGASINLAAGETVEFSLEENIPNTTSWIPYFAWYNTADGIEILGAPSLDNSSQPVTMNFFYSAKNRSQTMLVFYKNATVAGIPTLRVENPLVFVVNVE